MGYGHKSKVKELQPFCSHAPQINSEKLFTLSDVFEWISIIDQFLLSYPAVANVPQILVVYSNRVLSLAYLILGCRSFMALFHVSSSFQDLG